MARRALFEAFDRFGIEFANENLGHSVASNMLADPGPSLKRREPTGEPGRLPTSPRWSDRTYTLDVSRDALYPEEVIRSFRSKDAEALFQGYPTHRFRDIARVARRKLMQLHAAQRLDDMRAFPANHLEALGGDRRGQHSIRINDQYRICFVWKEGDAEQVEVVDYH